MASKTTIPAWPRRFGRGFRNRHMASSQIADRAPRRRCSSEATRRAGHMLDGGDRAGWQVWARMGSQSRSYRRRQEESRIPPMRPTQTCGLFPYMMPASRAGACVSQMGRVLVDAHKIASPRSRPKFPRTFLKPAELLKVWRMPPSAKRASASARIMRVRGGLRSCEPARASKSAAGVRGICTANTKQRSITSRSRSADLYLSMT